MAEDLAETTVVAVDPVEALVADIPVEVDLVGQEAGGRMEAGMVALTVAPVDLVDRRAVGLMVGRMADLDIIPRIIPLCTIIPSRSVWFSTSVASCN
jgi:hypothetical protein